MPKKRSQPRRPGAGGTPQQLQEGLDQADSLMNRKRWIEARAILEPLDQRYPNRYDVLAGLSNIYFELNEYTRYLDVAMQLARLAPRDPDIALMLAGAYLSNVMPVLALRSFRQVLKRWPEHPRADDIQAEIGHLEGNIEAILASLGVEGEQGFETAALHEEARAQLEQGHYAAARRLEEQLLRRWPGFTPALNNLSLIQSAEGQFDQAIATARQVLTFEPDNYHALANLVRLCCMSGRVDEAQQWADQLRLVESDAPDSWIKKAEAASFLGDDQMVLDALRAAEHAGHLKPPAGNPLIYHLAGVAAMRLGRDSEAHGYWRQALKLAPGFPPTQATLEDLRQPIGERNGPWALPFNNWLSEKSIRDLIAIVEPALRSGTDTALAQAARRYLKQHPEMVGLAPLLLDRGDPVGREHAVRLASLSDNPELLAALRDFALSQRGSDRLRNRAAQAALHAGLLPRRVTMWSGGEWREILLMDYTLHSEPSVDHAPNVAKLLTDATIALQKHQAQKAETLLNEALAIEPDKPDLLNNLAVAYDLQGRDREAEALTVQIVERHPTYALARTGLARTHLLHGRLAAAQALLDPMLEWERFHISEFANFCIAQIERCLAEGNRPGARDWLNLWTSADPNNPAIAEYRQRLDKPNLRERLFGRRS